MDSAFRRTGDPAVLVRLEAPPGGREVISNCGLDAVCVGDRPVSGLLLRLAACVGVRLFGPRAALSGAGRRYVT